MYYEISHVDTRQFVAGKGAGRLRVIVRKQSQVLPRSVHMLFNLLSLTIYTHTTTLSNSQEQQHGRSILRYFKIGIVSHRH